MYEAKPICTRTTWTSNLRAALLAAAILAASAAPVFAADGGRRCAETVTLSSDGRHHGADAPAGEPTCYRLEVPGPGFLVVAVDTPGEASPKLRLRGKARTEAVVVGRSVSHLTLWIREGVHAVRVEVAPQGPDGALGEHFVTRRFLAETDLVAMVEPGAQASLPTKDGEEGEIDPILVTTDGTGDPFDLRTLRPGMYTILVERRNGAEGPYSLIFATLSW